MSDFFVTIGSWLGAISFFATVILGIVLIAGKLLKKQFQKPKKAFFISLAGLGLSVLLVFVSFLVCDNNESDSEPSKQTSAQNHKKEKNTSDSEKTITKEQYQNIKIGMTNNEVEKILGKVDKDSVFDLGSKYEWEYSTKGVGLAYIDFDKKTNKVVEKSEIGVLSDGSTTVTDKNGTRNNDSIKNTSDDSDETANDDYANYIEMDINDAIGDKVDWNGKKKNTVREVEVNDNMGKQDGSKLILVRLNAPVEMTNKFTKEKVNEQTLEIAKAIKNDPTVDFKIDSITYFWYLPLTDQYGNTKADTAYKISLEKSTLDKINFKHLENVDLPAIADQYNVLYNE